MFNWAISLKLTEAGRKATPKIIDPRQILSFDELKRGMIVIRVHEGWWELKVILSCERDVDGRAWFSACARFQDVRRTELFPEAASSVTLEPEPYHLHKKWPVWNNSNFLFRTEYTFTEEQLTSLLAGELVEWRMWK